MSLINLIGKTFGRLKVVAKISNIAPYKWECICECGNKVIVYGAHLRYRRTKSCGCLRVEQPTKHGHSRIGKKTKVYIAWRGIKERCHNPNNPAFQNYGGRGITVCERWRNSFENFLNDMGEPPPKTSIDRYPNNDGNYEPGNCRWATRSEQNNNTRQCRFLEFDGKVKTIAQWERELGCKKQSVRSRIRKGWSIQEALATPVRFKKNLKPSTPNV